MNRRIVRTGIQLGVITLIVLFLIFIFDNRFRVLPNKIHKHLPNHHSGLVLTDITVASCSSLNPVSSCSLDPAKWYRVEKDLFLDKAWFSHAYVHVERKKEDDLLDTDKVIFDIKIGRLDPTMEGDNAEERWESRPGGLWLLRSSKRHASDSDKAVTAADVLFGPDAVDPRPGWEIKDHAIMVNTPDKAPEPRLSIRRGQPTTVTKPTPRVRNDGKFKIIQVSDLHLSTGTGVCRDPEPPSKGECEADPRTLEFIGQVLDSEKPDLAVLSGDQVNGETAPDAQTAVLKFADLFIKRKIPYAIIFGNHDDEGSLSRTGLMDLTESLPYSLAEAGPKTLDGIGNYVVEVLARGNSHHSALTLYLLDTHAYSPDEGRYPGYDWLKKPQIDWFREMARSLRHLPAQKEYPLIHLNMAFIHIPLPEYRDTTLVEPGSGTMRERVTAPSFNAGFKDALVENNVFAVSCGHDHANDYCAVAAHSTPADESLSTYGPEAVGFSRNKLWMCYAGGSGLGGYGGYDGYRRRVRVWDFDLDDARVETWKRVEGGGEDKVDVTVVVKDGNVMR